MEMLGEWDDLLMVIDEEIKEDKALLFAEGVERQFLRWEMHCSEGVSIWHVNKWLSAEHQRTTLEAGMQLLLAQNHSHELS